MKRALIMLPLAALLMAAGNPRTETSHTVREGETLDGIANRAGVSKSVIAEANGLYPPYKVRKGQRLVIPRQRTHRVKRGETGYGIANRYGVPFSLIAAANGLDDKGTVKVGQRLIIPAVLPANRRSSQRPTRPYFRPPHDGKVVLGYAMRKDGGGHDGLDYKANPGDMVRASANGIVTFAGWGPKRYGRMVVIDHSNGWRSLYAHLARTTVSKGEYVKAGERIGIAGKTGDAESTELHFEIRRNGRKLDPKKELARR